MTGNNYRINFQGADLKHIEVVIKGDDLLFSIDQYGSVLIKGQLADGPRGREILQLDNADYDLHKLSQAIKNYRRLDKLIDFTHGTKKDFQLNTVNFDLPPLTKEAILDKKEIKGGLWSTGVDWLRFYSGYNIAKRQRIKREPVLPKDLIASRYKKDNYDAVVIDNKNITNSRHITLGDYQFIIDKSEYTYHSIPKQNKTEYIVIDSGGSGSYTDESKQSTYYAFNFSKSLLNTNFSKTLVDKGGNDDTLHFVGVDPKAITLSVRDRDLCFSIKEYGQIVIKNQLFSYEDNRVEWLKIGDSGNYNLMEIAELTRDRHFDRIGLDKLVAMAEMDEKKADPSNPDALIQASAAISESSSNSQLTVAPLVQAVTLSASPLS